MPLSLQDRLDILDLCARYNRSVDSGDAEGWLAVWTEDGVFETPFGTFKGHKALRSFLRMFVSMGGRGRRHWSGNFVLEGEGDGARLWATLLLVSTQGTPSLFATGTYTDTLQRVGGAWRFKHRKLALDSMEWMKAVRPPSPGAPKPG
ncbi:MAG: nuclear transport factor 2 family protein [Halobacteria archaeon]